MNKQHHMQPFGGVADLKMLLEIIKDEKKFSAKLKAMEDLRDEINQRIELVGKVNEIEAMHAQATLDAAQVKASLSAAEAEAARRIAAAQEQGDAISAKAAAVLAEAEEIRADALNMREANRVYRAELDNMKDALDHRQQDINKQAQALASREGALVANETDYAKRKKKLEAALSS